MIYKKIFLVLLWLALAGVGGTLMTLAASHLYLSPSLPSVESLRDIRFQTPLRIYSHDGKLIGEIGEMRRTPIKFQDIPKRYIDALLSAEDAQFYSHRGVSITGLLRASTLLLLSGDIQGGGSTITMQVARHFFLSKRQEFSRKFNEILLALRIERELSKQEILELYVNVIFLGNRAYGIQAAAQVYYGTTLDHLTLPQLAMLAGIPKAPSTMNPLANPHRAMERRNWILQRMYELKKIDQAEYTSARDAPIEAKYHNNSIDQNASYIAEMARIKAIELFGTKAYTDGYSIYTTIDSQLQAAAQQSVVNGLLAYDQRHGYRGPEKRLGVPKPLAKVSTAGASKNAPLNSALNTARAAWHQALLDAISEIPIYAQLVPAAVISIEPMSATVLSASGEKIQLGWEQGLATANRYLSADSRGPKPEQASDVLALGDVIRITKDSAGVWQLTQIPKVQAALVSLDQQDGAILALIGGLDFQQSSFNRVTQAKRQPGSSFKPFLYTAALENGFTAASIINDAPIVYEDSDLGGAWRPENNEGKFYGPTRLRKGLYLSRNLVSIRVLQSVGIDKALAQIDRFGFDPQSLPKDLTLALGSSAVTPLDMATGYAVLANGGYKVNPYFIERIVDSDGRLVFETKPATVCHKCDDGTTTEYLAAKAAARNDKKASSANDSQATAGAASSSKDPDATNAPRVIDAETAYIMDSMLKDVVNLGTAKKAKTLNRNDLAGKTGTTNNATDAWFSGYGGGVVTTTWLGFDQAATLGNREVGGTGALPIWIDYMGVALAERSEVVQSRPLGLVTVRINPNTGKRARVDETDAIYEIFASDNAPSLDDADEVLHPSTGTSRNISTDSIF